MFTLENYLRLSNNHEYLAALGNWIHVKYTDVFWLTLFVFCVWSLAKTTSLRYKFIYFLFIIATLSIWGYWAFFDGLIFMMLLTELLVILLFLLVFLSYNFYTEDEIPTLNSFYWWYFGAFLFYALTVPLSFGVKFSYYDFVYLFLLDIVPMELFFFFFFFFMYYPTLSVYIATLLGLFSLVFICIYFMLKRVQQSFNLEKKAVVIVRKQNFIKQALLKTQLQTFQK